MSLNVYFLQYLLEKGNVYICWMSNCDDAPATRGNANGWQSIHSSLLTLLNHSDRIIFLNIIYIRKMKNTDFSQSTRGDPCIRGLISSQGSSWLVWQQWFGLFFTLCQLYIIALLGVPNSSKLYLHFVMQDKFYILFNDIYIK